MTIVRSPNIYGRVRRTLRLNGIPEDAILPNEIYDEINEGQKQVFLRVPVQKEKTIAMVVGQVNYTLVESTREVYGSISQFIRPSTWNYPIEYVYPNDWDNIVNSGEFDNYTNPVRATIVASNLKLYPAPTAIANLTLFVLCKMPATDLSALVEPETPEDFDTALGDWALWKLTSKVDFFNSFLEQIKTVGNTHGYKGYKIQKGRVIW